MANKVTKCTPAFSMRLLAVVLASSDKAPEASTLAKTV
jgi:hypothetical protein